MKTFASLVVLVLATFSLAAQWLNLQPENSCSYYGEEITDPVYGFASSAEAENTVFEIVHLVGLEPNFEIRAGNVPNAIATIQDGKRLIVYSQSFMFDIQNRTGSHWPSISILAHEIAHHLNGHTISDLGSRPELEIQADKWSGFVLAKMGATVEQAKQAIASFGSALGSATHPPKSARLEAIAVGWQEAMENTAITNTPSGDRPTPTDPSEMPTGIPTPPMTGLVAVSAIQNQIPAALNNYEVFVQDGQQIQHYWRSWAEGKWHKGPRLGQNIESAPAIFRNQAPGVENNYELFVTENGQVQHYWFNAQDMQWRAGSRFGSKVQSAPAAFQNQLPGGLYNYEILVREGNRIQHYWRSWETGQWEQGGTFGTDVRSAPAVFQNAAPEAQYNYEVFVQEGDHLQHYWLSVADFQWRKGARAGSNVQSAPAVLQNQGPNRKYFYELVVQEGNQLQHYWFNWNTKQFITGKRFGTNIQSAPAVFQNMAEGARHNFELFVIENGAVQHYWRQATNGQWLKGAVLGPDIR